MQKTAMQLAQARINPLLAAATIATFVGDEDPRMDSFALWLADVALAASLKWPFAIPLLTTQQKMFRIRANGLKRRVRFTREGQTRIVRLPTIRINDWTFCLRWVTFAV